MAQKIKKGIRLGDLVYKNEGNWWVPFDVGYVSGVIRGIGVYTGDEVFVLKDENVDRVGILASMDEIDTRLFDDMSDDVNESYRSSTPRWVAGLLGFICAGIAVYAGVLLFSTWR